MPPSSNADPADLWLRIAEMPRPSEVVDFPRNGADGAPVAQLRVWVLTQEEQIIAAASAEKQTRDILKRASQDVPKSDEAREGYEAVYGNCAACEVLFRACRNLEDPKRNFFPSVVKMRETLTVDELGVLMNVYNEVQSKLGPIVSSLSGEEYEAWVELLAKGAAAFPLGRLSSRARTELIMRMASDLWSSWTSTSSNGSPPTDGQTESAEPSGS